jgi:hypothetical protein
MPTARLAALVQRGEPGRTNTAVTREPAAPEAMLTRSAAAWTIHRP